MAICRKSDIRPTTSLNVNYTQETERGEDSWLKNKNRAMFLHLFFLVSDLLDVSLQSEIH